MSIPIKLEEEIYTYAKLIREPDRDAYKKNIEEFLDQLVDVGKISHHSCEFSTYIVDNYSGDIDIMTTFEIYISYDGPPFWEEIIALEINEEMIP
jgi:hypothetical protein